MNLLILLLSLSACSNADVDSASEEETGVDVPWVRQDVWCMLDVSSGVIGGTLPEDQDLDYQSATPRLASGGYVTVDAEVGYSEPGPGPDEADVVPLYGLIADVWIDPTADVVFYGYTLNPPSTSDTYINAVYNCQGHLYLPIGT